MEEVIKTVNLHKWFGSTHAVEDVNLSVPGRWIFGFLGLNGWQDHNDSDAIGNGHSHARSVLLVWQACLPWRYQPLG